MLNLGVLASGRGSNFQAIIDEIEGGRLKARIQLLLVDNPEAYAIERAKEHGIEYLVISPKEYSSGDDFFKRITEELKKRDVGLVVLAGFMRIVRKPLLDAFPNLIMNIHPGLLPAFSGLHAQRQALEYGVKISGCSVHFVDEGMDTGPIIIQAAVPRLQDDTEETLSERILKLEHEIYPEAIKLFSEGRVDVEGRRVRIKGYIPFDNYMVNPGLSESKGK